MANVYLTCAATSEDHPFSRRDFERMIRFHSMDTIGRHALTDDARLADIIAFIGSARPNFSDVRASPLYREFARKVVLFCSNDRAVPLIPGIYASLEEGVIARRRKSLLGGIYLRVSENEAMDISDPLSNAKYLFSFVGNARNHPVREEICRLVHERAYIRDSSTDSRQQDDGVGGENRDRGLHYRDVMARSKFVLCPRGIGVSSWRLFETMRAGRVPVIVSDKWRRPPGPEWDDFAVFVAEADVRRIPAVLAELEPRAEALGAKARREWDSWYAPGVVFTTVVDQLLQAKQEGEKEGMFGRAITLGKYFEPFFFRHWVLSPASRRLRRALGLDETRSSYRN